MTTAGGVKPKPKLKGMAMGGVTVKPAMPMPKPMTPVKPTVNNKPMPKGPMVMVGTKPMMAKGGMAKAKGMAKGGMSKKGKK
jgi:hypothetical protein